MDENDLKWLPNEIKVWLLLRQFNEYFLSRHRKLSHFSDMQYDVSMHRQGLKGYILILLARDRF